MKNIIKYANFCKMKNLIKMKLTNFTKLPDTKRNFKRRILADTTGLYKSSLSN